MAENFAAIDCGTNCQETFDHGASVTLTATPDASATFTGWSGACTGAGACQVTLEGAKSVTATFAQISYIVVTATAGTGGSGVGSPGSWPETSPGARMPSDETRITPSSRA